MKKRVLEVITQCADEINKSSESKIPIEDGSNALLFGKNSTLDSLALVNLIVSVETTIEDDFGVTVTIADERAMSQKNSPFKTIGTLADYICLLLEKQKNG